jgi:hypothetical protein
MAMTREQLLRQLLKLLPTQFEAVVFLARIPRGYLPALAPQATLAVDVMRYIEQQNQLDQLTRIVQQVITGGQSASDPQ